MTLARHENQNTLGPEPEIVVDGEPVELISPDSLTAEMVGHWTYLVLEAAAFLMQGMHPVIADVTDRYSIARTDPGGRAVRSVDSVLRWTYGGLEAVEEGRRLRSLHQPLTMRNAEGKHVSALDPGAYQWVIATAYITTVNAGPLLMGREFTVAEQEELLRDNRRIARIVRVPMKGYPETREEFDRYFDRMIETTLVAGPATLASVDQLRHGRPEPESMTKYSPLQRALLTRAMAPGLRMVYLAMVAAMDPRIRTMLGIEFTAREQARTRRIFAAIRVAYRVLPDRLTYFPLAYHARKHHECIQAMQRRELKSAAYRVRPKQPLRPARTESH
ncbi:oxygenase MpaB family protein [Nocardia sp. BMG111209]|uniref:oxygenase MpaB family protein n=1 Tax=Nocardia sp. BMG111209 TaxID=1160137 RepID=UPI0003712E0C|nr:oxygenase MpaB family protein [Nocardia sp. BMG111209]